MQLSKDLHSEDGWRLRETGYNPERIVASGSNFLVGNGYMGYRGTTEESTCKDFVACIVSDTYDNADGKWRELCNVPNPLYVCASVDGTPVVPENGSILNFEKELDMKGAVFSRSMKWKNAHRELRIQSERFASMSDIHLLVSKYCIHALSDLELSLDIGVDANLWSLNGDHLPNKKIYQFEDMLIVEAFTSERDIPVIVCEGLLETSHDLDGFSLKTSETMITRNGSIFLSRGERLEFSRVAAVYSGNDVENPLEKGICDVRSAREREHQGLKDAHDSSWKKIWSVADIEIEGDHLAQVALRFNLYHNIIATPRHADHLPIGARGLSCQAYQGGAFWDQEVFNLPFFIFTEPEVARKLLVYRYRRLDAARKKARRLGYEGAFYPWISGDTDEELCPSHFFSDVLTGRRIRNHFNDWQIHVSPDIVYAIWQYYSATDDYRFIEKYGAEMVFEVARFLYSHAHFKKTKQRYEIIRVLGPDEYHENIDNSAYTNYFSAFSIRKALEILNMLQEHSPKKLQRLTRKINLSSEEISGWQEMAEMLFLPQPDLESRLIEQFDGYFSLEDTSPEKLSERLKDPNEYWGWPNGVAVETQVIKQADVVQLICMLPELFTPDVQKANYDYYEPRTHHRSSLSPSVHSIVASRLGYKKAAYEQFIDSVTVDLFDVGVHSSGGTFIGGIHTGACGAAWQMAVFGFAGLSVRGREINMDPAMPDHWKKLSFKLVFHGQLIEIELSQRSISAVADERNTERVALFLNGSELGVEPGMKKIATFSTGEESVVGKT